jgi:hypothetical protein
MEALAPAKRTEEGGTHPLYRDFEKKYKALSPAERAKAGDLLAECAGLVGNEVRQSYQSLLDFGFSAWIGSPQKVEEVRILEELSGHVGVSRRHGMSEIILSFAQTKMQLLLDLDFQNATAPAVDECLLDIELARSGFFDPLDNLENVSPG